MVNEMFLPRENARNYLQFLQRLLKSCKSNLSANDNGCVEMDEVSYLEYKCIRLKPNSTDPTEWI